MFNEVASSSAVGFQNEALSQRHQRLEILDTGPKALKSRLMTLVFLTLTKNSFFQLIIYIFILRMLKQAHAFFY